MKKLLLLALSVSLLFASSCKKDSDSSSDIDFNCTYLKVREGSTITSKIESFGSSTPTSITSTVVDQEEIDGTLVAVFETENGQQSYLSCEGEKFIVSAQETTTLEGNITVENVLLTLDFGRAIGDTYQVGTIVNETSVQGYDFVITNRYEGTVIATDQSMEVDGTTYTGVAEFDLVSFTENSLGGGEYLTTTTKYYVAPEVGPVMSVITDELQGMVITTVTLEAYVY